MKTKNFDSVAMKWLGAKKVREKTAAMTRAQELEFWQQQSRELRRRQEALKSQESKTTT